MDTLQYQAVLELLAVMVKMDISSVNQYYLVLAVLAVVETAQRLVALAVKAALVLAVVVVVVELPLAVLEAEAVMAQYLFGLGNERLG